MFTKTKIALVTGFLAVTSTGALAQNFDPNPANRYPAYAGPGVTAPYLGIAPEGIVSQNVAAHRAPRALQSAPVRLHQGRNAADDHSGQDPVQFDFNDRASSPYAGGVG
jgi:hypothetical protein